MYKILFFAIGALAGVSADGFFLGMVLGAGGFLLGIFADSKSRQGESPKGMIPTPTAAATPRPAATATATPASAPASASAQPKSEVAALRQEVATLRLQVEHLTRKVNAIAGHSSAPLDAQALAELPPVDLDELTAQALGQPTQTAVPAAAASTTVPSIRVAVPVKYVPTKSALSPTASKICAPQ